MPEQSPSAIETREREPALGELGVALEELRAENDELRESRDSIEAERRRYAQLFDLAPVGYLITDLAGVVREANRCAAELLDREARSLIGRPLAALVGVERRAAFHALVDEAAAGARWYDEVPFVRPGEERIRLLVEAIGPGPDSEDWIRWSLAESAPSADASRPGGAELAAAHKLQRHRMSALLDRLHHGVVTVSPTLRVTYANSAAAELLAPGRDPVGRTLVDPWPEPSLCELAARVFEHRADPGEARVTLDDGNRVYEVLALPPDASGDALLVIADVTANERRQRAEREFVANAAHQLRTPVSAIASSIEVLQGGAKDIPEARERFLTHLDRQCERLVRLTRALLILARAQALAEPPALEVVALGPLLDGIAKGLRPGPGVRVQVQCPHDLAALANRDLLEQAIENLAENAAKYTVEGSIVLCAEPWSEGRVRVVIVDTGPGADLPTDGGFRRFYRDPAAQGEGFGLGLAIAGEAMRVLRGDLRIESSDSGTRTITTLPAARIRHG